MTQPNSRRDARIAGTSVPPLLPEAGPVHVLIVGEAPGPRGADKSGVPFFGDAAGEHLYGLLAEMGAADVPDACASLKWDGALFAAHSLRPALHGVALGNAYDQCPSDDGLRFRAPTRAELESSANIDRVRAELRLLGERGLRGVVTLGRVATRTLDIACDTREFAALVRRAVPHPSAQGLLSMAPDRGRGARMAELKQAWKERCRAAIEDAGWRREASGA
jgi:uracil-DNA glycosylase